MTEPRRSTTAIHHVAFACRDVEATHRFYGEILGLELACAEVTRIKQGHLRHFFYDTGDGSCLAFFHLNDVGEPADLRTAISTDLDLPVWVNHVALRADPGRIAEVVGRLRAAGGEVEFEIEHGWCRSTYLLDPNGILVELCQDTPGMPDDPELALRNLRIAPEEVEDDHRDKMIRMKGRAVRVDDIRGERDDDG